MQLLVTIMVPQVCNFRRRQKRRYQSRGHPTLLMVSHERFIELYTATLLLHPDQSAVRNSNLTFASDGVGSERVLQRPHIAFQGVKKSCSVAWSGGNAWARCRVGIS